MVFATLESIMKAADIMTPKVVSVSPQASIQVAADLMIAHRNSGLPVVDESGTLIGIVTEGDLLRRIEIGTERKRSRWLELFIGPGPACRRIRPEPRP
jgi:CBS domain-containing protein